MEQTKADSPRILIVDDDEVACQLLAEVLLEEGYEVQKVHNGEEAIKRAETKFYDLVITDLKMADLDGLEVLKKCRQINPGTVVILITAFGCISSAVKAIKAGAFDYVSKPFSKHEIKIVVRQALFQKRLQRTEEEATTSSITFPFENCSDLSPRQQEIVLWVIRGRSNQEIAERLFITEQTVKDHLHDIFKRLQVRRRSELILKVLGIPAP
jgi:two-component system response regulator AtoC